MSVARPTFTPPAERRSVLDRAHVGDIEGALGHRGVVRHRSAPLAAPPAGDPAGHHGTRPGRHDRGQRRRRPGRLRAGRPELRHEPAVGAAAARPRPLHQPGDGRAPRRGHRRRPCAADRRALRASLGRLRGRRPAGPQRADPRHRFHRRGARAGLLRRLALPRRAGRRGAADRRHRRGRLPPLGADHVRPHRGQPRRHPARAPHPRRQPLPGRWADCSPVSREAPRRPPCC